MRSCLLLLHMHLRLADLLPEDRQFPELDRKRSDLNGLDRGLCDLRVLRLRAPAETAWDGLLPVSWSSCSPRIKIEIGT